MYPEYMAVLKSRTAAPPAAPATYRTAPDRGAAETGIHVQKVQGNVYMLSSAAGNIAVQAGDEGVIVVDAGPAELSPLVLGEIGKLSSNPIRLIVNTNHRPTHTGGNHAIFAEGETIAGGDVVNLVGGTSSRNGAIVIGHENVVKRMTQPASGGSAALAFGAYPTDTYAGSKKDLFLNGDSVRILHVPNAQTDGDSMVHFRRADVISTGDVFSTVGYPQIAVNEGGTIQGEIDALNEILRLTIPALKAEGGTYVIPGHGRLSDMADVAYYRDMVTIIRDRILDMKRKGMTLEQVKANRPTRDYDGRWGSVSGEWTTEMFVEAVYRTVDLAREAPRR
jgi:glyoxylase-like metal-dependent hydrolase (beta-lactamase superfamily II)